MKKIDVVELFAGVGGFRVGLNNIKKISEIDGRAIEKGDWNFVWANQWEPSTKSQPAYECYITRFGKEDVSNEDIANVDKTTIPSHDLLVGGFPCQDYSVARSKSNEMGIQGIKGVLWWEIAETILKKKPKFVLLENVDRLLKSPSNQRGRDYAVMLKTFDELGYIVQWRVVNAGEYNMPQRRKRVFIFASRKDTIYSDKIKNIKDVKNYLLEDGFFNNIFPILKNDVEIEVVDLNSYDDSVHITEKYNSGKFLMSGILINGVSYSFDVEEKSDSDIFSLNKIIKLSEKYNIDIESYKLTKTELEKWEYLKGSKRIPRLRPNGTQYYYSEGKMTHPDNLDLPARTMLTSEGTTNRSSHSVFDDKIKAIRRITEVEAELIQMFPPNWTNTGMTSRQRYFMMGNALVTGVISRLEPKLKEIILNEKNRQS